MPQQRLPHQLLILVLPHTHRHLRESICLWLLWVCVCIMCLCVYGAAGSYKYTENIFKEANL